MSVLATYYARAKEAMPEAVAISIMSGIQTTENVDPPQEWWTIMACSTPLGQDAVYIAHRSGDTFEEALAKAVEELREAES